jgi:hypothetical protein
MPHDLTRLNDLHGAVLIAEMALHKAIAEELPKGSSVYWVHGKSLRYARVVDHSSERILVESSAGKRYWIHAWRVYHDGHACA